MGRPPVWPAAALTMADNARNVAPHLRLVEPAAPADLPAILTDAHAQKKFKQLTQSLVDIAIEITDLVDGDPELEPNGDEFEDSDGGI